jgi:hypothetical protein
LPQISHYLANGIPKAGQTWPSLRGSLKLFQVETSMSKVAMQDMQDLAGIDPGEKKERRI